MFTYETKTWIDTHIAPLSFPNIPLISVVSMGEIHSLALQNNWGELRMKNLSQLLNKFLVVDIQSEDIIQRYAEIDAFSQGKLAKRKLTISARDMGKNDLWIAATASVIDATLITLDNDFVHLDNIFIKLAKVE